MVTIWKFPIALIDKQTIDIPLGAKILSVQIQDGTPCIWAQVDTSAMAEKRKIAIVGTGNPCWCADWDFIETIQDGVFVWHVFAEPADAMIAESEKE